MFVDSNSWQKNTVVKALPKSTNITYVWLKAESTFIGDSIV